MIMVKGLLLVVFLIFLVGLCASPETETPRDAEQSSRFAPEAAPEETRSGPDTWSPHTLETLALFRELLTFRHDPQFHRVGFSLAWADRLPFVDWMTRCETLEEQVRKEALSRVLSDIDVVPGEVCMLGRDYMSNKGRVAQGGESQEAALLHALAALDASKTKTAP